MSKRKEIQQVRPETKNKILSAWAEEFKAAGLPSIEEARDEMQELLKSPGEHEQEEFVSSGLAMGLSWTPFAMIENQMDQWEEPSPEELESTLKRINGIRYEMRGIIAEASRKLLKTLAHRLGGRPLVLKPDQHPEVCQEVANLLSKRVPLQGAFKRVGDKYNVSARTIQRIWRKRPTEPEDC